MRFVTKGHPWSHGQVDQRTMITLWLPLRRVRRYRDSGQLSFGVVFPSRTDNRAMLWTPKEMIYFSLKWPWSMSRRTAPQRSPLKRVARFDGQVGSPKEDER